MGLAVGLRTAATLRQVHDRTDRFTVRLTREYALKVHGKALLATEIHKILARRFISGALEAE
jgi:hypothetical protein